MRLTVIGCAGSFPGPDSPASSYLVQADDAAGRTWNVLLDLGNGAFGALQRDLEPFDLDAVAITHLHPDHFIDMCGLYVYLRYHPERGMVVTGQGAPLAVHGPAATSQRVGQACGLEPDEDVSSVFDVAVWSEQEPWRVGPLTITPFGVEHPIESYALRVTGPSVVPGQEVTLTFSGDTDATPNLVAAGQDADLFLIEAAFVEGRDAVRGVHLTGKRAGQMAAQAGARRVLLTHLPAWTPDAVVIAEARQTFSGPIDVVHQGAVYEL